MKHTKAVSQLAGVIMADPDKKLYGYDLTKAAHMRSGVLYPILHRMLDEGWLTDGWDTEGKRPRRYYELTEVGRVELAGRAAAYEETKP